MIRFVIFLFLTLFSLQSYSQTVKQEKRIYLLDVTASMIGKGVVQTPNIFNEVKSKLSRTIQSIRSPYAEVVIIPFTNTPFPSIKGTVNKKDSIITEINKIEIRKGDTNIAGAWERGLQELDSTKINYMFLLTDGLHNCGVEKEELYERLSFWQTISANKYMFAFYVMLTPNAKEQEITQIADKTNQMWLIESMDVNVSFINSSLNVSANVNQDHIVRLGFTSNNEDVFRDGVDFRISLEKNPYYKIKHCNINFSRKFVDIELEELLPKLDMPTDFDTLLKIEYDKTKYPLTFFTPEVINFHIVNKGIRTMNIRVK